MDQPKAAVTVSMERVYPLPELDTDERFTHGLVLDVARLLTAHGYPPLRAADMVELQQALFGFLYRGEPS